MPTEPERPRSLLSLLIADLERWEGKYRHLYLDTKGLVTTGIGNLVRTPEDAVGLGLVLGGVAATPAQARDAWAAVKRMQPGLRARSYEVASPLRLTEEAVDQLVARRLNDEFVPGLRRLWPSFDAFPVQAKSALVDMAYNCGLSGLAKFTHLGADVQRQDWVAASSSCHRMSARPERNDWTAAQFMYAASQPEFLEQEPVT